MRTLFIYLFLAFYFFIHQSCAQFSEPYPYNGQEVIVQEGETALDIANRYGITLKTLVEDNFIVTYKYVEPDLKIDFHQDSLVHPGQVLRIYNFQYTSSTLDQALKHPQKVYAFEIGKCPGATMQKQILGFENLVELYMSCEDSVLPILGFTSLKQLDLLSITSLHNLTTLPEDLIEITQLKHLNLHFNGLSELPAELVTLDQLKHLNLGSNKFSTFPVAVSKMESLEILDLESNGLQDLPPEIGNIKSLKELNLTLNALTSLPAELGELDNLEVLNLQLNALKEIPDVLMELKNLRELNLASNDVKTIPTSIGKLETLEYLNLEMNNIQTLPEKMGTLRHLTQLDLSDNKLDKLPSSLLKALPRSCRIDLRNNNLSNAYVVELRRLYPNLEIIFE